jgi:hypothetical protein
LTEVIQTDASFAVFFLQAVASTSEVAPHVLRAEVISTSVGNCTKRKGRF